ncbi:MAG: heavy-metal-associated domain-containing protein [Anaerolineaceae bacterium]|nr:heavy-metal-associated domain-containing protein [Anaerolineaceae bacterium]
MKTLLRSQELTCPSCVVKIEKALTALPGVQGAKVFFNTGRIEIQHNPDETAQQELVQAVWSAGYEARISTI